MNLREARAFVAVCEERNFSRAAARLFVAPSTLSETIALLERRSSCTLFHRTTRSVDITPDGMRLLPAARDLLRAHETTESLIDTLSSTPMLHVGVLYGHATEELREAAKRLDLEVLVMIYELDDLTCGLSTKDVDAAILAGPVPHDGQLQRDQVWSEKRVAVVHRSHPLAGRRSVSLEEVDKAGWVAVKAPSAEWQRFWRLDEQRGGPPREIGPAHSTGTSIFRTLLSGHCALVTLETYVRMWAADELAFVPVKDVPAVGVDLAYYSHLATPSHERLREALRSLH